MSEQPKFKILSEISRVETIARGSGIHKRHELRDRFGGRNWRKMKGFAVVEDDDGWIGNAEIHWFEGHGVGRVEWKIKRKFYDETKIPLLRDLHRQ